MTNWQHTEGSPREDFERAKEIIKADTSGRPADVFLYPDQAELLGLERRSCLIAPHYLEKLVIKFLTLDALKRALDE